MTPQGGLRNEYEQIRYENVVFVFSVFFGFSRACFRYALYSQKDQASTVCATLTRDAPPQGGPQNEYEQIPLPLHSRLLLLFLLWKRCHFCETCCWTSPFLGHDSVRIFPTPSRPTTGKNHQNHISGSKNVGLFCDFHDFSIFANFL